MSRGSTAAVFAPRWPLAALSEGPNTPSMRAFLRLARSHLDHESHRPRSTGHALVGLVVLGEEGSLVQYAQPRAAEDQEATSGKHALPHPVAQHADQTVAAGAHAEPDVLPDFALLAQGFDPALELGQHVRLVVARGQHGRRP